jgi:hypothetical protein
MIYYYDIQYFMMICIQCEKTRKIYVVIGWWFFAFPVDKLKVELARCRLNQIGLGVPWEHHNLMGSTYADYIYITYIYRIGYSLLIIIWNSDKLYTDYTDCIHSNVRWDVL